jgi:hypothetical protein
LLLELCILIFKGLTAQCLYKSFGIKGLTINDNDIEVVNSFKYMWTAISNTNDGTKEVKHTTTATNKASSPLQTIFRTKQIH